MKINKRKIQYASLSSTFIALFIVAVLLVNVLVGLMTERFSLKLDLTATGEYSISETTKDLLEGIDEEITIFVMSSEGNTKKYNTMAQVVETARRFVTASGGKISLEFIDPNQNPKFYDDYPLAKANKANSDAAFLIVAGQRRYSSILYSEIVAANQGSTLYYSAESEIAGSILYVISSELSKVATITGHDEETLTEFENIIDGNGFERIEINLANEDIPEGVNNLVIAAPKFDYTPEEIAKIDKFLTIPGNNVYVFWSYAVNTELPVIGRFLNDWGIKVDSSVIVLDQSYAVPKAQNIPISDIQDNDATVTIERTQRRLLIPMVHPIKALWEQKGEMRVLPIAKTANSSYARLLNADIDIRVARQDGEERGPFIVGAVAERAKINSSGEVEENRVIVFGSDLVADEEIIGTASSLNNDVLNAMVSYANPNTSTMAIAPKMIQTYDLNFYESQVKILFWLLVVIVPILILAAGIFIFINRRHR